METMGLIRINPVHANNDMPPLHSMWLSLYKYTCIHNLYRGQRCAVSHGQHVYADNDMHIWCPLRWCVYFDADDSTCDNVQWDEWAWWA